MYIGYVYSILLIVYYRSEHAAAVYTFYHFILVPYLTEWFMVFDRVFFTSYCCYMCYMADIFYILYMAGERIGIGIYLHTTIVFACSHHVAMYVFRHQ